jgi:hypothetical protein
MRQVCAGCHLAAYGLLFVLEHDPPASSVAYLLLVLSAALAAVDEFKSHAHMRNEEHRNQQGNDQHDDQK